MRRLPINHPAGSSVRSTDQSFHLVLTHLSETMAVMLQEGLDLDVDQEGRDRLCGKEGHLSLSPDNNNNNSITQDDSLGLILGMGSSILPKKGNNA